MSSPLRVHVEEAEDAALMREVESFANMDVDEVVAGGAAAGAAAAVVKVAMAAMAAAAKAAAVVV